MTWTEAVVLLYLFSAPACQPNDVDRFPPDIHVWCSENESEWTEWRLSNDRDAWVRAQKGWAINDWVALRDWEAQEDEQRELTHAWYLLSLARYYRKHDCPDCAIAKLGELRAIIGDADYAAGQMPPPIPYWRYTEIRR